MNLVVHVCVHCVQVHFARCKAACKGPGALARLEFKTFTDRVILGESFNLLGPWFAYLSNG